MPGPPEQPTPAETLAALKAGKARPIYEVCQMAKALGYVIVRGDKPGTIRLLEIANEQ